MLAAERGRLGERYILGHRDLTLAEILAMLATLTGRRAPTLRVPFAVAFAAADADTRRNVVVRRRAPSIPVEGVRMSRPKMFCSSAKAIADLGLPQTPVEEPLRRAIDWFQANGYA